MIFQLVILPEDFCNLSALGLFIFWMFILDEFLFCHFFKELTNFLEWRILNLELDSLRSCQKHKVHKEPSAVDWQLLLNFCQFDCIEETFLKVLIHKFGIKGAFLFSLFLFFIIRPIFFHTLLFGLLFLFFFRLILLFTFFFLSFLFTSFFVICFFVVFLVLFRFWFFLLFN